MGGIRIPSLPLPGTQAPANVPASGESRAVVGRSGSAVASGDRFDATAGTAQAPSGATGVTTFGRLAAHVPAFSLRSCLDHIEALAADKAWGPLELELVELGEYLATEPTLTTAQQERCYAALSAAMLKAEGAERWTTLKAVGGVMLYGIPFFVDAVTTNRRERVMAACREHQKTLAGRTLNLELFRLAGHEQTVTLVISLPPEKKENLNDLVYRHSGIGIGEEFYDYGHTGNFMGSPGSTCWDTASVMGPRLQRYFPEDSFDSPEAIDLEHVLYYCHEDAGIDTDTWAIQMQVTPEQFTALDEFWQDRYANPGTYSILPWRGRQCTNLLYDSLVECGILRRAGRAILTPQQLLNYVSEVGENTSGPKAGERPTFIKVKNELPRS